MLRDDPAARKFETLFGPEFGHGKPLERARVRKALAALNSPQWNMPTTFHVAGTNGKGSTIAFMRAIAEAAGLSVHVFTKPHLLELRERFRVAGKLVDNDRLMNAAERVAALGTDLTHFEAQVVCAFMLFANESADITLIEAGLGGRDDATNVIPSPAATILTPVGLDHQDVLGEQVVEIAQQKAGIMKGGVPAIVARQHEDVKIVIEQAGERLGAPLVLQGVHWDAYPSAGSMTLQFETRAFDLPPPALYGSHQIDNAGLAAAALLTWGDRRITSIAIATGMTSVQWRGRLEPVTYGALFNEAAGAEFWVDAGHNPHGAEALARALRDMARKRAARTVLIIGMRARKDWSRFVDIVAREAALVIGVPLGPEGAPADQIAEAARQAGAEAKTADTLRGALRLARENAAERILVCGSLLLAGEAISEGRPIN